METIGTRIKKLRKQKKMTQGQLGKLVGVSDVTVSYWEKDVNEPIHENLATIAQILDSNESYIKFGIENSDSISLDMRPITRLLPVLSYVQAGTWTSVKSVNDYEIESWLAAPPSASKNAYYLIVQGTSNNPHFFDGDFICIDPDIALEYVQTGDMIVAQCNGDATFKALVREPNGLYLQALNPNFQPNIIRLDDDCIYKGKYIGKFEPPKKYL